jgi:hypothetical protein
VISCLHARRCLHAPARARCACGTPHSRRALLPWL